MLYAIFIYLYFYKVITSTIFFKLQSKNLGCVRVFVDIPFGLEDVMN